MNIGQASERSGLPSKTIRYYEEIGLISPQRAANGYRDYDLADIHRLRFLHRARRLGFSIEECRQLLSLYGDRDRASADVKAIAQARLAEIDTRIVQMLSLKEALLHLIRHCHGDQRPHCPILDDLSCRCESEPPSRRLG